MRVRGVTSRQLPTWRPERRILSRDHGPSPRCGLSQHPALEGGGSRLGDREESRRLPVLPLPALCVVGALPRAPRFRPSLARPWWGRSPLAGDGLDYCSANIGDAQSAAAQGQFNLDSRFASGGFARTAGSVDTRHAGSGRQANQARSCAPLALTAGQRVATSLVLVPSRRVVSYPEPRPSDPSTVSG